MKDDPKKILESLKPLFEKAEKEGLWFKSGYQQLLFSPVELKKLHKEGRYIWGPINWALIDPGDLLDKVYNEIIKKVEEHRNLFVRIIKSKTNHQTDE
jgi:hypothetical protein